MSRKKRSEKLGAAVKVRPAPAIAPPRTAERVVAALCPLCGRSIPENRALKVGSTTVGKVGYFDSIDWDPSKPFGVSFSAAGRGSLSDWEYISPEQAPELFEAMKKRFLEAIREWENKGWLKREEIP